MKTCNKTGCNYNQFGGGYCKNHQRLRTDKKIKFPNRTPIKIKKPTSKILGERKEQQQKDWEFYLEIWNERPHVDYETNEPIYGEPCTLYFHHVLPKRPKHLGGYPEYRYEKWNILLVSWDTHNKADNNLDLVPKIKAYTEKIKKLYT